ncbi:unnamed protein product [Amoebophrya sp. A25]|nr:unnamed protein product [Amoebophrya sp. A25]|eukprot:GSA25T00002380001.1
MMMGNRPLTGDSKAASSSSDARYTSMGVKTTRVSQGPRPSAALMHRYLKDQAVHSKKYRSDQRLTFEGEEDIFGMQGHGGAAGLSTDDAVVQGLALKETLLASEAQRKQYFCHECSMREDDQGLAMQLARAFRRGKIDLNLRHDAELVRECVNPVCRKPLNSRAAIAERFPSELNNCLFSADAFNEWLRVNKGKLFSEKYGALIPPDLYSASAFLQHHRRQTMRVGPPAAHIPEASGGWRSFESTGVQIAHPGQARHVPGGSDFNLALARSIMARDCEYFRESGEIFSTSVGSTGVHTGAGGYFGSGASGSVGASGSGIGMTRDAGGHHSLKPERVVLIERGEGKAEELGQRPPNFLVELFAGATAGTERRLGGKYLPNVMHLRLAQASDSATGGGATASLMAHDQVGSSKLNNLDGWVNVHGNSKSKPSQGGGKRNTPKFSSAFNKLRGGKIVNTRDINLHRPGDPIIHNDEEEKIPPGIDEYDSSSIADHSLCLLRFAEGTRDEAELLCSAQLLDDVEDLHLVVDECAIKRSAATSGAPGASLTELQKKETRGTTRATVVRLFFLHVCMLEPQNTPLKGPFTVQISMRSFLGGDVVPIYRSGAVPVQESHSGGAQGNNNWLTRARLFGHSGHVVAVDLVLPRLSEDPILSQENDAASKRAATLRDRMLLDSGRFLNLDNVDPGAGDLRTLNRNLLGPQKTAPSNRLYHYGDQTENQDAIDEEERLYKDSQLASGGGSSSDRAPGVFGTRGGLSSMNKRGQQEGLLQVLPVTPCYRDLEMWFDEAKWHRIRQAGTQTLMFTYIFPIHLPTYRSGEDFLVSPEVVKTLKSDASWLEAYRRSVHIVLHAWGYDVDSQALRTTGEDSSSRNYQQDWWRRHPNTLFLDIPVLDRRKIRGFPPGGTGLHQYSPDSWKLRHLLLSLRIFQVGSLFPVVQQIGRDMLENGVLLNVKDQGVEEALQAADDQLTSAKYWLEHTLWRSYRKKWIPSLEELLCVKSQAGGRS